MNKNTFASARKSSVSTMPAADSLNAANGPSYSLGHQHALAQALITGVFQDTFYAKADAHVEHVRALAKEVTPEFLAKAAVYASEKGYMKDAPAFILAYLSTVSPELFRKAFPRIVKNGKMLRNFVQVIRSGEAGRKSLGNGPKTAVANALNTMSDRTLINAVGSEPTIGDVIQLAWPNPEKSEFAGRRQMFEFLKGRKVDLEKAPAILKEFEDFKAALIRGDANVAIPDIEFRRLTALSLTADHWKAIARNAPWHMTRMNLNTFARQGVFGDSELVKLVATRLADRDTILKSKAFPYQLLAAFLNVDAEVPRSVRDALVDAAEIATENVPTIAGQVVLFPDVSGSMKDPVTGRRGDSSASKIRFVDVAGLMVASVLRKNPDATIIAFDTGPHKVTLSARDSILTNAAKLAAYGGGGTNCSIALREANARKLKADIAIYFSDNQSWVQRPGARDGDAHAQGKPTETAEEWETYRNRNAGAKLVCLDVAPYGTSQALNRADILNIGGFSDSVFEVISQFALGNVGGDAFVKAIEAVEL